MARVPTRSLSLWVEPSIFLGQPALDYLHSAPREREAQRAHGCGIASHCIPRPGPADDPFENHSHTKQRENNMKRQNTVCATRKPVIVRQVLLLRWNSKLLQI